MKDGKLLIKYSWFHLKIWTYSYVSLPEGIDLQSIRVRLNALVHDGRARRCNAFAGLGQLQHLRRRGDFLWQFYGSWWFVMGIYGEILDRIRICWGNWICLSSFYGSVWFFWEVVIVQSFSHGFSHQLMVRTGDCTIKGWDSADGGLWIWMNI